MMKPRENGDQQRHLGKLAARNPPAAVSMISSDKNLMPSMVVRQQRGQQQQNLDSSSSSNQISNSANNNNHPSEPSTQSATTLELLSRTRQATADCESANSKGLTRPQHSFDQNGLILPRRVPHQPAQLLASELSGGPQVSTFRDLNRELKFNQAHGKNVLEQKSELKRAMDKLEASRRKKEAEQERLTRRSSLELRLEERAERLARISTSSAAAAGEPQASERAANSAKSSVLS